MWHLYLNIYAISEKCIVTSYVKEEFILIIRQAIGDELKALVKRYEEHKDLEELLNRKEAARFLKISKRTLITYQDSGLIPHYRLGRGIYFKKGELLESLETSHKLRY